MRGPFLGSDSSCDLDNSNTADRECFDADDAIQNSHDRTLPTCSLERMRLPFNVLMAFGQEKEDKVHNDSALPTDFDLPRENS